MHRKTVTVFSWNGTNNVNFFVDKIKILHKVSGGSANSQELRHVTAHRKRTKN
jgi:hypothetical protein